MSDLVNDKQAKMLYAKSKAANMEKEDLEALLSHICGVVRTDNVPWKQCDAVVKAIEAWAPGQTYEEKTPAQEAAELPPRKPIRNAPITAQPAEKDRSFALAYAKDIIVARISSGAKVERKDLFDLAESMLDWLHGASLPGEAGIPLPPPEPDPDDDNLPF